MKNLLIGVLSLLLISCGKGEDKKVSEECQAVEIFISDRIQLESCFASNLFYFISSSKPEETTMESIKSCDHLKSSMESRLQKMIEQKKISKDFLETLPNKYNNLEFTPIRIRKSEAEEQKRKLCLNKTEIECKEKMTQLGTTLLQGKCVNFIEQGTKTQFTECFVEKFLAADHQALKARYNCK